MPLVFIIRLGMLLLRHHVNQRRPCPVRCFNRAFLVLWCPMGAKRENRIVPVGSRPWEKITAQTPNRYVVLGCLRGLWSGWVSCSLFCYIKPIPIHEKLFAMGKSGPYATAVDPIFLGLGWPWVGEFVGL